MSGDETAVALAALHAAVDALLETDFEALDESAFPGVLDSFEVERRRLEAVDVRLLAATDQQHVAARHCRSSLADLLVHRLRLSPGEARARVRRARDLGPRRTLQGVPLEPIHPQLSAAQRAGAMSTQQLDVAAKTLERIPADISVDATPTAEELMVEAARHQNPYELARTGTMLLQRLDPDGDEPNEQRAYGRRELWLHRRRSGSWKFGGELTDEAGHALRTVLDPLAALVPAHETADGVGERDPRSAAERDHDALLELCTRVLRSGTRPLAGGAPVTLLGGDAELVPLLFDRVNSECRLMLRRTQRLANRAQRRALAARDGGCSFPGARARRRGARSTTCWNGWPTSVPPTSTTSACSARSTTANSPVAPAPFASSACRDGGGRIPLPPNRLFRRWETIFVPPGRGRPSTRRRDP